MGTHFCLRLEHSQHHGELPGTQDAPLHAAQFRMRFGSLEGNWKDMFLV